MKCQHKFRFLRQSMVYFDDRYIEIEVWECIRCKKLQIIDRDNSKIISLGGRMGEEVSYDR